ncbi:MAG: AMP-binding protein [Spirochaetia bacterium]
MKRTVISMLLEASRNFTQRPFVAQKEDSGWRQKTFMEVLRDSRAFAAALVDKGIRKNQRVAIFAEGSPEWVTAEFGVILTGAISVPLSFKLRSDEIPLRINHSEAETIIVSKNMLPKIASIAGKIVPKVNIIVINEHGSTLKELRETSGEEFSRIQLFREILLDGYRLLEDMQIPLDRIEDEISENDVVTISYTSGTTGDPKGIMLTHLNYWINCHDSVEMFEVPPAEYSTLLVLPCDHSFAHSVGIYSALLRGITLYFVDARGGETAMLRNIPANLKETHPVFLLTVPALTENFMKKIKAGINKKGKRVQRLFYKGIEAGIRYYGDGYNRSTFIRDPKTVMLYHTADKIVFRNIRRMFGKNLKFFVGGGALLSIDQQQFFRALGIPIYQGYGLTEAAPVISSNTPQAHKLGTSGLVAPSVSCKIIDDNGVELSAGEKGEIVIQGDNVMKGYFKNPKSTKETIIDGWLRTGDIGFLDEDGFLRITGRRKALLISRDGEKYSPESIEEAILSSSDYIKQVMLYNDHNTYTVALIVTESEEVRSYIHTYGIISGKEVLEFLNDQLNAFRIQEQYRNLFPRFWLPYTFQIIEEPFSEENEMINSSMKMVRHKIALEYKDRIDYMYTDEGKQFYNPKNIEAAGKLFPEIIG